MIFDEDERAWGVAGVDGTGSICNHERSAAEEGEDAGGKDDIGDGQTLVQMNATLHDGNRSASDAAEDELAGVADDSGAGEVRDLCVGDGDGVLDVGSEVAEAGAENDADAQPERRAEVDVVGGGTGAGVLVGHVSQLSPRRPAS